MVVRRCFLGEWGMLAAFLPAKETRAAGQIWKAVLLPAGLWDGACVQCHINDSVPLVPQFPLRGALDLAQAVSIRGEQMVLHSGVSAVSEDEQQRPHRAGLQGPGCSRRCSGSFRSGCSIRPLPRVKPGLCV